jgi:DNA-binding MarR family transcriptional regulator
MAEATGCHRDGPMIIVDKKLIPEEIVKDSVLLHIAAAYFSIGKRMAQKTQCSQTRGFIMSTLRGGVALNQNQIATLLGFDRTVVHRAIKAMVRERLVSEKKAEIGKAILVRLTPKGNKYRESLIKARRAVDEKLRRVFTPEERGTLLRLLRLVAELEL